MKELLRYVQPQGPLPEHMVNSKQGKKLLIACPAACVWEDISRYDFAEHDLMAVNAMMSFFPGRLDYGATLHPDHLPGWGFKQAYLASHTPWHPMETMSVHQVQGGWVKRIWPIHRDGGTSGLFAVLVGLLMGYDLIVLAGSPLDGSHHFYEPPLIRSTYDRKPVFEEWKRARDAVFNGKVKSLSGNSRELLGEP